MIARAAATLIGPMAVIPGVVLAFGSLIDPVRRFETTAAVALLHALGVAPDAVEVRPGAAIAVYPDAMVPFLAVISPACSSLSSLLAVAFSAMFTPRRLRRRRLGALGCALVCVAAGNIVRIAGSIAVGLAAGPSSLVLFHDWVGSMFAFTYTLLGYLLMLSLLLSGRRQTDTSEMGIHAA